MTIGRIACGFVVIAIAGWLAYTVLSVRQLSSSIASVSSINRWNSRDSFGEFASVEERVAGVPEHTEIRPREQVVVSSFEALVANDVSSSSLEGSALLKIPAEYMHTTTQEVLCGHLDWPGVYYGDVYPDSAYLGTLSLGQLQALADVEEDGVINHAYGSSIIRRLWEAERGGATQHELDAMFEEARHYFIRSVRHKSREAASWLGLLYYNRDRIESRAWWHINMEMGGNTLESRQRDLNSDAFSEQEDREGIARAAELIDTLDLASGLAMPERCLEDEDVILQRKKLAALYLRYAQEAIPADAPDAQPTVFDTLNGYNLVVEDVCTQYCLIESERLIHYEGQISEQECSRIDGVQRAVRTLTSFGVYEEQIFCVPTFHDNLPGVADSQSRQE